ncbi:MAG: hypothetical protein IIV78_04880, partial [Oscillospiraceae bacterium]|nr:hypothetical protein [Oscillospiraceae bacterium]
KLLAEEYGFMLSDCDDFDAKEELDEFACEKNEKELTELKKRLVQKKTLADRIDVLGLAEFLIMGKGDIRKRADEEPSVKEDLFEAILGAAAIDSGWNWEELETLVDTMLSPDTVLGETEENFVALIEEWTARKGVGVPHYHFEDIGYVGMVMGARSCYPRAVEQCVIVDLVEEQKLRATTLHCLVKISNDLPPFRGYGCSKSEARRNACKMAYDYLCNKGLWFTLRDEIDNPNRDDAIGQLEILARRGYFSVPEYTFEQGYDGNGNPAWKCQCSIEEENIFFEARSSSKKDAKKTAAFKMLQYVLNDRGGCGDVQVVL